MSDLEKTKSDIEETESVLVTLYSEMDDNYYMKLALQEAMRAYEADEVPVGAVVVAAGRVVARGHNLTERLGDVTAHAEMQVITAAANAVGG